MRRARTLLLLGVLLSAASARAQTGAEAPVTAEELERMALEKNPTLFQAAREVDAARGRAKQAGLLPNPIVGYSAEELPLRENQDTGQQGFYVQQTLPLGGKLSTSRATFLQEVREAEANLEAQRLRVVNGVRTLYIEALLSARRVQVRERLSQLASEAVEISRQLFNVGAADQPDLLESEIEARQASLNLASARNDQYHTWRSLAVMVGEPGLALSPLAGSADSIPELDRDAEVERLLRESPQVAAAQAQVARAEFALRRANREPFPDLFVRGGPRYNRSRLEATGRRVGWQGVLEVGISIPLWNQNQGNRAAARAQLERARAEMRRVELALRGRFSGVFETYLTSLRMAEEYRSEILPRAERAYRLYLDRFREMGAAYPQVLIAQRTFFQTNDRYVNALQNAQVAALQIQGFLLVEGLDAPPVPGEPGGIAAVRAAELPGAVRAGELPVAVESRQEQ